MTPAAWARCRWGILAALTVVLSLSMSLLVMPGARAEDRHGHPQWQQEYGRGSASAPCAPGWNESWAQWPHGGVGGFVCERLIPVYGGHTDEDVPVGSWLSVEPQVTTIATRGHPFTALPLATGELLVSVSTDHTSSGRLGGIEVFAPTGEGYASRCFIPLPSDLPGLGHGSNVMGLAVSADGTILAAALEDAGLGLYRVEDLLACRQVDPVVVAQSASSSGPGSGTLDVVITPDSEYAFVDNEYGRAPESAHGGNVAVVALSAGTSPDAMPQGTLLRQTSLPGRTVAGITLSPDATRLYVTTEVTVSGSDPPGIDAPILGGAPRCQQEGTAVSSVGVLSVIDVAAAVAGSPEAVIASVASGCAPTRITTSTDGSTVYVTARGDSRLLVFDAATLEGPDPASALIGHAATGTAPVGSTLFFGDRILLIADSNRFAQPPHGSVELFDVTNPATPVPLGTLPAGLFPRNVTLAPDGSTLFVTEFASNDVLVLRPVVIGG